MRPKKATTSTSTRRLSTEHLSQSSTDHPSHTMSSPPHPLPMGQATSDAPPTSVPRASPGFDRHLLNPTEEFVAARAAQPPHPASSTGNPPLRVTSVPKLPSPSTTNFRGSQLPTHTSVDIAAARTLASFTELTSRQMSLPIVDNSRRHPEQIPVSSHFSAQLSTDQVNRVPAQAYHSGENTREPLPPPTTLHPPLFPNHRNANGSSELMSHMPTTPLIPPIPRLPGTIPPSSPPAIAIPVPTAHPPTYPIFHFGQSHGSIGSSPLRTNTETDAQSRERSAIETTEVTPSPLGALYNRGTTPGSFPSVEGRPGPSSTPLNQPGFNLPGTNISPLVSNFHVPRINRQVGPTINNQISMQQTDSRGEKAPMRISPPVTFHPGSRPKTGNGYRQRTGRRYGQASSSANPHPGSSLPNIAPRNDMPRMKFKTNKYLNLHIGILERRVHRSTELPKFIARSRNKIHAMSALAGEMWDGRSTDNLDIRCRYPRSPDEIDRLLESSCELSQQMYGTCRGYFVSQLNNVRDRSLELEEVLLERLGRQVQFRPIPVAEVNCRLQYVSDHFIKVRINLVGRMKHHISNMRWVEATHHRVRKGELDVTQNQTLCLWLFQRFTDPYPLPEEKQVLMDSTGLTQNQVNNWFINARVRRWKPMVESIEISRKASAKVKKIIESRRKQELESRFLLMNIKNLTLHEEGEILQVTHGDSAGPVGTQHQMPQEQQPQSQHYQSTQVQTLFSHNSTPNGSRFDANARGIHMRGTRRLPTSGAQFTARQPLHSSAQPSSLPGARVVPSVSSIGVLGDGLLLRNNRAASNAAVNFTRSAPIHPPIYSQPNLSNQGRFALPPLPMLQQTQHRQNVHHQGHHDQGQTQHGQDAPGQQEQETGRQTPRRNAPHSPLHPQADKPWEM